MQRRYRLTESAEFERVRRQGRSYPGPLLVLHARRSDAETTRAGIAVGKRVGKAVTRNRVKRRIRETLRLLHPRLQPGWELLFVARPGAAGAKLRDVAEAIEQGLGRAGALKREPAPGETPAKAPPRQAPTAGEPASRAPTRGREGSE